MSHPRSRPKRPEKGFTLIELLIVVAIIAILAAIAVPNFLEAQTRSKVARVRADLRSVATALESYMVDANKYPPTPWSTPNVLTVVPTRLSTPIAYITTAQFEDPFMTAGLAPFQGLDANGVISTYSGYADEPEGYDPRAGKRYYFQLLLDNRRGTSAQANLSARALVNGAWEMASLGPNRLRDFYASDPDGAGPLTTTFMVPYDATNGTVSVGDILRTQSRPDGLH